MDQRSGRLRCGFCDKNSNRNLEARRLRRVLGLFNFEVLASFGFLENVVKRKKR